MTPIPTSSQRLISVDSNDVHVVASVVNILTNFHETHPSRIQHAFNLFAELLSQVNKPLRSTVFEGTNVYFSLNGGLAMCRASWDRGYMDMERAYYLSRLSNLLRVDILEKIDPLQLESKQSRDLYFFLKEFQNIRTREDLLPEKVHELSEFVETEKQSLMENLTLPKFLKTLQAINVFTHASLACLAFKRLSCADVMGFWAKKMPENERFPSCNDIEKMIKDIGQADFARVIPEEKFEKKRWKAFSSLNMLTEKQLMMWQPQASQLSKNYRRIQSRMKRVKERMIHVRVVDTRKRIEKEEKKSGYFAKLVFVVQKIIIWLTGYIYHHPFFLTNFPDEGHFVRCGKKEGNGVYHDHSSGRPKTYLREYEIDLTKWLPENVDERRFNLVFYTHLEELIRPKNEHLKLPGVIGCIWKSCVPSLKPTIPSEICLEDPRERSILCNEYVGEALIEAHVKACRELGVGVPADLSFYGFRKWENLGAMTPTYFAQTLIRTGFLHECYNPLL